MNGAKKLVWRVAFKVGAAPALGYVRQHLTSDKIPRPGTVRFGSFRRTTPISREYGYDRGLPIDRYYIEAFLEARKSLITGHVLEIGERLYTEKFGCDVTQSDMLHVEDHPDATYVDDLTDGETVPSNTYDCVILTQTLHLIFDMKAAIATIFRVLKPGGVLLCTVPGITQVADPQWNDTWYWSLTKSSALKLHELVFQPGNVEVVHYGNVLTAVSFLHGLAEHELRRKELDLVDPEYPVTLGVMARAGDATTKIRMADRWDYADREQFSYDEDTSYKLGLAFLDGHGDVVEDWGCGTAYAKQFVTKSTYVGIDGSFNKFADIKAELQEYTSDAGCIFMRHVLEHNWGWRQILKNAVASFQHRLVVIVFTPFGTSDNLLASSGVIPDLALNKNEVLAFFAGMKVREEALESRTEYGSETIFYVER